MRYLKAIYRNIKTSINNAILFRRRKYKQCVRIATPLLPIINAYKDDTSRPYHFDRITKTHEADCYMLHLVSDDNPVSTRVCVNLKHGWIEYVRAHIGTKNVTKYVIHVLHRYGTRNIPSYYTQIEKELTVDNRLRGCTFTYDTTCKVTIARLCDNENVVRIDVPSDPSYRKLY